MGINRHDIVKNRKNRDIYADNGYVHNTGFNNAGIMFCSGGSTFRTCSGIVRRCGIVGRQGRIKESMPVSGIKMRKYQIQDDIAYLRQVNGSKQKQNRKLPGKVIAIDIAEKKHRTDIITKRHNCVGKKIWK